MTDKRTLLAVLAAALLVGAAGSAIALTDRSAQADRPDARATASGASGANASDAPSTPEASPEIEPEAARVVRGAAASVSRLAYVHGKATTTTVRDGRSSTSEAEFYADRSRSEVGVRFRSPERSAGDTLIVDGTSATAYDASDGAAYVADADDAKAAERGAKSSTTDRARESSARAAMTSAAVGQRSAPGSVNATERAAAMANATTIDYEGTATVDGEETVVLRIAAADGATVTLFHDAETYLPKRIVVEADGATSVTTVCYYEIGVRPTDAAAPFGVPDDATVVPAERAAGAATGATA